MDVCHEGLRLDVHDNDTFPSVDVASKVRTRSQQPPPITCLNYGKDREVKFPAYFFCSNCKKFEDRHAFKIASVSSIRNRATSKRYRCTADHTRPEHPTVTKDEKLHCLNKNFKKLVSCTSTSTNTTSQYDDSIDQNRESVMLSTTGRNTRNIKRICYTEEDDFEISNEFKIPVACSTTTRTSTSTTSQHEAQMASSSIGKACNMKRVFSDEDNNSKKSSNGDDSNSTDSNNEHDEFEKIKPLEFINKSLKKELDDIKNKLDMSEKMRLSLEDSHRSSVKHLQEEISTLTRKIEINMKKNQDLLATKRSLRQEQKSNQRLNSRVIDLKNQIENIDLASLIPLHISLDDFFLLLVPLFEKVASRKNRLHINVSDKLVEFMWNSKFLSGCVRSSIIEFTKKYFRETFFSPARILQLLDMNGGQLSYQGLDLLRELETNGEKYVSNTIIPHSSRVKRICAKVDKYASIVVPFKMDKLKDGSEYAEFQPEHVLPLMYKGYKVEEKAKERSICIDQSIDAVQITTRQQITVWGVKMVDPAARDPKTGNLLFGCNEICSVQSRNHCFPMKFALARETNDVFDQFYSIMAALKELTIIPLHEYKPIKCAMDCDLSATWKLLKMGGAYRNKLFGCHLCAEKQSWVGQHHGKQCSEWCKKLHSNNKKFKCRHQPIFSPKNVENMKEKIDNLKDALGDLEDKMNFLVEHSSIKCNEDPNGVIDKQSKYDIESIHYDLNSEKNSLIDKDSYSISINDDLALRNLDTTGDVVVRQQRLKQSLINEWTYRGLTEASGHYYKNHNQRLLNIMECVPDVLHMECRCGIKVLQMLLTEGINNAGKRKTFTSINSKVDRAKAFVKKVEDIANKEILGNEDYPACWHVPLVSGKGEIDSITLDNNRTRALMNNLHPLIDLCVFDEDRKVKFKECIGHYIKMFVKLRKKEEFSDDDINEFQSFADDFYNCWIDIQGRDGVTNYIHMLGSGHVADFLKHYRNFYIHSQQGWEHFNSFLKVYFFRRTMRGGGRSGGSKIKPLARWLARRMVWMSGIKYADIEDALKKHTEEQDNANDDEISDVDSDSMNIHDDNGVEVDNLLGMIHEDNDDKVDDLF